MWRLAHKKCTAHTCFTSVEQSEFRKRLASERCHVGYLKSVFNVTAIHSNGSKMIVSKSVGLNVRSTQRKCYSYYVARDSAKYLGRPKGCLQTVACDENKAGLSTVQMSIDQLGFGSAIARAAPLPETRAMALPHPSWLTAALYVAPPRGRMQRFVAHACTVLADRSFQVSRLARIRQVKAASCNAFMDSKKRTELYEYKMAAAAAAAAAAGEAGEGAGGEVCVDAPHHTDVRCTPEIDLFQLQHHHLLTCLEHTTVSLSSIRIRLVKWLRGINTSKNYGASPAIWDHTVFSATRHRWTCSTLTQARQAGTWFT